MSKTRQNELETMMQNPILSRREKVDVILELSNMVVVQDVKRAEALYVEASALASELEDGSVYQAALGYIQFGKAVITYFTKGIDAAFAQSQNAEEIIAASGEERLLGYVYNRLSMIFWDMGDFTYALNMALKALKINVAFNDIFEESFTSYLLGGYQLDLKDYDAAEQYFKKALTLRDYYPDSVQIARSLVGMADVLTVRGEYAQARRHLLEALGLQEAAKDFMGKSRSLNDLGNLYKAEGDTEQAFYYYGLSEALRREQPNKTALVTTLSQKGILFSELGRFEEALQAFEEALAIALPIGAKAKIFRIHKQKADIYKLTGNTLAALESLEEFIKLKEEVLGDEVNLKMKNLQTKHEVDKSEKEAQIFRLKNVELREAYDNIERKNRDIEEKNRNITASINYARRIQEAILPSSKELDPRKGNFFVFFRPRDIVSGDFYWYCEKGGKIIVAAVDCTGHGVPGAFMTVMGNSLLNEIVKETDTVLPANEILYQLDNKVRKTLHQETGQSGANDGMDIALLVLDPIAGTIDFAGAKLPLFLVRKGACETFKGSLFPIGSAQFKNEKTFEGHRIAAQENDMLYIFSDGFQDQFGGAENKKFMKKQFRDLLISLSCLPMEEQQAALAQAFDDWKGNTPQTDDVLVIGVVMRD